MILLNNTSTIFLVLLKDEKLQPYCYAIFTAGLIMIKSSKDRF
jgi:hypothetical protein